MANNNNLPTPSQGRRFCFTINNPTERIQEDHPDVRFLIYQKEEAPTTHTPHFQGYLEINKSVRFSWIHNNILGMARAALSVAKGTAADNITYCSKEPRLEGPWTFGTPGQQGQRSDLLSVKRAIDEGQTDAQIADDYFGSWVRYHKSFSEYKRIKATPRDFKTRVVLLYGPPGTGKSSFIRSNSPNAYWKAQDPWWDGYDGTSDVALDDFYGWIPYSFMLRLMDRYPYDVNVKGAKVNFSPKTLYISSNKLPHEWWSTEVPYNHAAFYRRIDEIIYMPSLGEQIVYLPEGTNIPPAPSFADFSIAHGTLRNFV